MKKSLLALALFAFAGSAALAQDGPNKVAKTGKKEACAMKSMAGGSCCMKKEGKTASTKPAAKALAVAVK